MSLKSFLDFTKTFKMIQKKKKKKEKFVFESTYGFTTVRQRVNE